MSHRSPRFLIGALVLLQAFLLFIPLGILGEAIDWPDSLDFAPSRSLPLIADNIGQVRLGYGIYLIYSVVWIAVGTALAWLATGENRKSGPLFTVAVGLICVSALARAIGVIRWLTATTALSESHANAEPQAQLAIEATQLAINAWGGAIGEILGVSLFTVLWLLVISVMIFKNGGLPRFLAVLGVPVAILLGMPISELFGGTFASIALGTSAIHLWLLIVGLTLLIQAWRNQPSKIAEPSP